MYIPVYVTYTAYIMLYYISGWVCDYISVFVYVYVDTSGGLYIT